MVRSLRSLSTSVPVTYPALACGGLSTGAERVLTVEDEADRARMKFIAPNSESGASGKDCLETLLAVKNLSVAYHGADGSRQQAVENASFEIGTGEVLGLMGESGCGKTSIALALLGLLAAEQAQVSGSIQFRGKELLTMGEREMRGIRGAGISVVFQEPGIALNPVMRVRDQVAEVIHAHKTFSWEKCRTDAQLALVRVGLPDTPRIFSAYPYQLSGGQRQRVALAQALVCEPALVIADEPTASVDARSQHELLALFGQLQREVGIAILLISHSAEVQARLADRLMVMERGKIVEQGQFEELYWRPAHACTRMMLRMPVAANVAEELDFATVT
jgi:microcin C transport system ATP-binding protein